MFFQKLWKKFYKPDCSRDVGTLAYYKVFLHRNSVNGKGKSRFAAHEDLTATVGQSLVREFALNLFGMENKDSDVTKHKPAPNVANLHEKARRVEFDRLMDEFLDEILIPFWVPGTHDHTYNFMVRYQLCQSTVQKHIVL